MGLFHVQEKDTSLYRPALEELRRQIRSSTTSMTSVPKPLKFLRPHYGKLKEIYENMAPGENKVSAAVLRGLGLARSLPLPPVGSGRVLFFGVHSIPCEPEALALCPQRFAADIISVLAMTMSGERECLKYRLVGSQEELASWGHEYVR